MQLNYSENRKAFVTGGASGYGLGTVKELLNIGAHVTIADIDQETLDSAQKELNSKSLETCILSLIHI